jgi:hypothetical protein
VNHPNAEEIANDGIGAATRAKSVCRRVIAGELRHFPRATTDLRAGNGKL